MKKLLVSFISLSFAMHAFALKQQLEDLSGALKTLEVKLKPKGGPDFPPPPPPTRDEIDQLVKFAANINVTETELNAARDNLAYAEKNDLGTPEQRAAWRKLIDERTQQLGKQLSPIPGEEPKKEEPVKPTPVKPGEPEPVPGEEPAKPKVAEKKLVLRKGVTKMPTFLAAATPIEISVPNGESMQAVIGILKENGNLVIWGPSLKAEPNLNTFFASGNFIFPRFDAVQYTEAGPNIQVVYEIYPPLINMVELLAQKQAFTTDLKNNVDQQVFGINQAIKGGKIADLLRIAQGNIPQVVDNVIAQLNKGSYQIEKIYPQTFDKRVLSVEQVEMLIGEIETATNRLVEKIVQEFSRLIQAKQDRFAQYISELKSDAQPDFALLAKRWNVDPGYKSTREDLKLFTDMSSALNAAFNQIADWAHIRAAQKKELQDILRAALVEKAGLVRFSEPSGASLKGRLLAQKQNKVLISVGDYYKTLQTTLREAVSQQQKAEEAEAAQQAFQAQAAREAERQKRVQELAAEAERQRQAEIGGVSEEEWGED